MAILPIEFPHRKWGSVGFSLPLERQGDPGIYVRRKLPRLDKLSPRFVSFFGRSDHCKSWQEFLGNHITGITFQFEREGVTQRHAPLFLLSTGRVVRAMPESTPLRT